IDGGLPSDKIAVKQNFLDIDPGMGDGQGKYVLFVGRLSAEKGLPTLVEAWKRMRKPPQLRIIGDGRLADWLKSEILKNESIKFLGRLPRELVFGEMKSATVLAFPSMCYESAPLTIIEAYAAGLPVVASRVGVMVSMVQSEQTGLHFSPGDPDDLVEK